VECGFFYVVNHGIDEELQKEVWVQSRAFFALPASIKMRFAREPAVNQRGYTPFGDEALDPLAQPVRGNRLNLSGSSNLHILDFVRIPRFRINGCL
jgi:hypothetical protein